MGKIKKTYYICFKNNFINKINIDNMAKPIRNTPILYGKDAKQFLLEIDNLPSMEERKKERARIEANVERLKIMVQNMKKH